MPPSRPLFSFKSAATCQVLQELVRPEGAQVAPPEPLLQLCFQRSVRDLSLPERAHSGGSSDHAMLCLCNAFLLCRRGPEALQELSFAGWHPLHELLLDVRALAARYVDGAGQLDAPSE